MSATKELSLLDFPTEILALVFAHLSSFCLHFIVRHVCSLFRDLVHWQHQHDKPNRETLFDFQPLFVQKFKEMTDEYAQRNHSHWNKFRVSAHTLPVAKQPFLVVFTVQRISRLYRVLQCLSDLPIKMQLMSKGCLGSTLGYQNDRFALTNTLFTEVFPSVYLEWPTFKTDEIPHKYRKVRKNTEVTIQLGIEFDKVDTFECSTHCTGHDGGGVVYCKEENISASDYCCLRVHIALRITLVKGEERNVDRVMRDYWLGCQNTFPALFQGVKRHFAFVNHYRMVKWVGLMLDCRPRVKAPTMNSL